MDRIDMGAGFCITRVSAEGYVEWRVVGDLNQFRASRFVEQVQAALARGDGFHLIDLTAVSTVDATGVHALVGLHKRCMPSGRLVVAATPGAQPRRMLDVTGASRILGVSQDRHAALRELHDKEPW